jgi:hypothetical protein
VSLLYVYAILGDAPRGALGAGLAGEPLRLVPIAGGGAGAAGAAAAAGEIDDLPPLDADALRAHDAAVRRLAAQVDAILPARFGSAARDAGALARALEPTAEALAAALARVRGCEQMTLRLYADAPAAGGAAPPFPAAPRDVAGTVTSGTQYLEVRRRARAAVAALAGLDALRAALAPLVTGERAEPHDTPPLRLTLYHLVRRGNAQAYAEAVRAAAPERSDLRYTLSGPWPPYAFAPEALT